MSRLHVRAIGALTTLALIAAACGSSAAAPTTTTTVSAKVAAQMRIWPPSPAGTWGNEPTVVVPSTRPPKQLVSYDLITGTGAAAKAGDNVTVQYVGVSYTTKKVFDASWNRHQAFPFQLGVGQVIPGWDQGVVGMKVGGRRELIIPPALAYGAKSPGAGIVANDTLIFIVDLVSVQPA